MEQPERTLVNEKLTMEPFQIIVIVLILIFGLAAFSFIIYKVRTDIRIREMLRFTLTHRYQPRPGEVEILVSDLHEKVERKTEHTGLSHVESSTLEEPPRMTTCGWDLHRGTILRFPVWIGCWRETQISIASHLANWELIRGSQILLSPDQALRLKRILREESSSVWVREY